MMKLILNLGLLLSLLSLAAVKGESIVEIYDRLHIYVNNTVNNTLQEVYLSDAIYSFPWNENVINASYLY